ncbi:hypothetical protein BDR07DRAFT_1297916 [Suillus spraguei]|nr:hypothetical protein BDR07DRAFT_1297916 [Suillus spraguei]
MTLLPFTILSLLHIPFVYSSLPNLNSASVTTLGVSDSPCSNSTRTLWEIIWSCAATLFACTWTAIHQNVPGMDERKFTIISRRLGIMMMALIAPELMITWATAQFLSARWTVTHGFFAWMGGFMLYVNDEPRATLTPDELLGFVHEGSVKMPVILEADIEDRSKGDALSKGIAMLQLAWFVIQLVARYIQNLPITLLELDTLAVAALTSIGYGFWWKKPMDVGRPYAVCWKATASPPRKLTYECIQYSPVKTGMIFCSHAFIPFSILWVVTHIIPPHAAHSQRVPSLGGHESIEHRSHDHDIIILLIGCFSGTVFGGIHCLGWNILFQGHAEQMLWRTASLVIVSAPVSILLLSSYMIWDGDNLRIAFFAAITSSFIYIVGRITVIVLISKSFRSLLPGVYDTVAWTRLVLHL